MIYITASLPGRMLMNQQVWGKPFKVMVVTI